MKKESKTKQLISFILTIFININLHLPSSISYRLSLMTSWLAMIINSKSSQTITENIKLCFPQLSQKERLQLVKRYLRQNAFMSKETAIAWLGNEKQIKDKIDKVIDEHFITELLEENQPIIIAVPHIGHWEYFWHWLQLNYPAITMYSPAKFKRIDQLMINARSLFGGNPYSTERSGIINIFKGLKNGKIIMILPDQAPNLDAGIYSPFFGYPALTMTLLHRLIKKTNARLLFGTCLRNSEQQFNIQLYKPDFDAQITEIESFNQSLNKQIEELIKTTPEQYLWNYKRFKRQPIGEEIYTSDRLRRVKHEKKNRNSDT
ncbi:MAG: hypothetical protein COB38_08230 [Gammaproteobacteria bacterium]|nr:MAG: hypothetical protein COB38_08230 [Gammaproteobacteria bacterium]